MLASLHPEFLAELTYGTAEASTLRRLGEYRGRQEHFQRQRPEVLDALRAVALVESMESSNRLEGILAERSRVQQLAQFTHEPRDRSEQEIAGYRDALALIHDSAKEMPFRAAVLLQLHGLIGRYQPDPGGVWKSVDSVIVERDDTGRVLRERFRAVSAVETPQAIEDLVRLHADAVGSQHIEPLVVVPLTILDFLCIHPFGDGNGRVSRLLTLQLLYHFDYQVGRYVSLERIFEESKQSYYETLEQSSRRWHDSKHDPMPWVRYFWGVLLRAYGEFERRVGVIDGGRGSKSQQVREAVSRRTAPFKISELERDCPGIGRETIRGVLRSLRDEGKVVSEGTGRSARWRVLGD